MKKSTLLSDLRDEALLMACFDPETLSPHLQPVVLKTADELYMDLVWDCLPIRSANTKAVRMHRPSDWFRSAACQRWYHDLRRGRRQQLTGICP